jgi:hypothetical protein
MPTTESKFRCTKCTTINSASADGKLVCAKCGATDEAIFEVPNGKLWEDDYTGEKEVKEVYEVWETSEEEGEGDGE